MLCLEDSRIIHENKNFRISLVHLLALHHGIIWGGGWKFDRKKYFTHKKESELEPLSGQPLVEN
jgi:hypothetical protein